MVSRFGQEDAPNAMSRGVAYIRTFLSGYVHILLWDILILMLKELQQNNGEYDLS